MNETLLTIFTPTYNRVDLLENLYDSLKKQTSYNFLWMIIDDGSTDDTEKTVREWINTNELFRIKYYKKENGGLQSGYVEAISHLDTELAMCIDSDDMATPNAVKLIEDTWNSCEKEKYAGIFGFDCLKGGEILGGYFIERIKTVNLTDLVRGKHHREASDRALIIRTDLYKKTVPAKRYQGELTMNATYLHLQISGDYDFIVLYEPLIQVEYQADGISKNKIKQYAKAPNTFADWRIFMLSIDNTSFSFKLKTAIHYINECIFARRKFFVKECSHKFIVFLAIPAGIAFHLYNLLKL